MPKPKKKTKVSNESSEESNEKIMQRFMKKKAIAPADFNPCCLTKEIFAIITLYGSAVLVILILFISINFFTSVLIQERSRIKNLSMKIARTADFVLKPAGAVSYNTDKINYGLNEDISLSITNNSNKSIFLEPCQYFNKFEKKELNSWKELLIDNCGEVAAPNSGNFDKVSLKENQSIPAVILGEGIWRGVSEIYLDCQKADAAACKSKKIVYSNEFKIEAKNTEVPGAL